MATSRSEVRERERRWAVPVGVASIAGIVLLVLSQALNVRGDGEAEVLREAHAHGGAVLAAGLAQTLGFICLALPLAYLFRAVQARSDRVRTQLIGLVVVAPLFLTGASAATIGATGSAADEFVAGDAKPELTKVEAREECDEERKDEGVSYLRDEYKPAKGETPQRACEDRKLEDDAASRASREASLAPLATGLGLGGTLGIIVALLYTGLWSMRTGLLSRFWGSLGMVAGVSFLLGPLILVAFVWFVYFGLLVLGVVPGGRPPAWEAGEAVPWPTPGEKAAAELEPEGGWDSDEDGEAGEDPATRSDPR